MKHVHKRRLMKRVDVEKFSYPVDIVILIFIPVIHGLWIVRDLIYIPNLRPGIELGEDVIVRIINPEVSLPLFDDCSQRPESSELVINSK